VYGPLLAALLCGCGGGQSAEQKPGKLSAAEERDLQTRIDLVRRQVAVKRKVVDELKTVKDGPSMKAALDNLLKLEPQATALARELRLMPQPSEAVQERLADAVGADLLAVTRDEEAEGRRINQMTGGREFFLVLGEQLKTLQSP